MVYVRSLQQIYKRTALALALFLVLLYFKPVSRALEVLVQYLCTKVFELISFEGSLSNLVVFFSGYRKLPVIGPSTCKPKNTSDYKPPPDISPPLAFLVLSDITGKHFHRTLYYFKQKIGKNYCRTISLLIIAQQR